MTIIQMTAPPLPHYIISGRDMIASGNAHPSRRNLGVFDLLYVIQGAFHIAEEDRLYEVGPGEAIILSPNLAHQSIKKCEVTTHYFWLHFHTTGAWRHIEHHELQLRHSEIDYAHISTMEKNPFTINLPIYTKIKHPSQMCEWLEELSSLGPLMHQRSTRWQQQLVFQQIVHELSSSVEQETRSQAAECAELAAAYLRQHYRDSVTAAELGEHLNFHPVYIARCMKKQFGSSPLEYLHRYRVHQAKLLLLHTNDSIARIAEEVGFQQASYFSTIFTKYEGLSPRSFRLTYH
ncbi:helix-turn-helix transcriptional regulator [Paenibacillus sp. 1001270B_150601_E10]|uniref:helix-turn-helix transcriptional regulator n=1 Tax=Paenibacillus sp. 1001270B_150601_E10 TaxID=2787079 RepID=UPI0018A115B4|nr:helix-turn-helix transcriptional regulator [Paenibacillus sp. 1001270B_150601_E10]